MRPAFAFVLALALSGCPSAVCPSAPLTPAPAARWVVRYHAELVDTRPPPSPIPGVEEVRDPVGVGQFAAVALFDAEGGIVNERWLDSTTTWPGASAPFDAAARLASRLDSDSVTVLLSGGTRSAVTFAIADGAVLRESAPYPLGPSAGGQLVDLVELGEGEGGALATRALDADAGGGDVLLLDAVRATPLAWLSDLSTGPVIPGRIALLSNASGVARAALVGLDLPDEPGAGGVALVALGGGATRLDLAGLAGCTEVVTLPPDPATPNTARAAALCTGDRMLAPSARTDAGLALLSLGAEGPPTVDAIRFTAALFPDTSPTHGLVGLGDAWVAVVSAGDPSVGRADVLLVLELTTAAAQVLYEEAWTDGLGAALGTGDYDPASGELWWPSATVGVLRFSRDGGTFTALPSAALPTCLGLPARDVRRVPSSAPLPLDCSTATVVDAGSCDVAACLPRFPSAEGEPVLTDAACVESAPVRCDVTCADAAPLCPSGTAAESDGTCWSGTCVPASVCPAP